MSALLRLPVALLAAIGVVSILTRVISLQEDVERLVEAYQAITRPIWSATLEPLLSSLSIPLPGVAKDYLTMVLITFGAMLRSYGSLRHPSDPPASFWARNIFNLMSFAIFWPVSMLLTIVDYLIHFQRQPTEEGYWKKTRATIILEFVFLAFVILVVSFALSQTNIRLVT